MTPRAIADRIRDKCVFTYARSGGPGGQNVNKVATKALARLPLSALGFLTEAGRTLIESRLAGRINSDGEIFVTVQDTREQTRNRDIAVIRLAELVSMALKRPKKRIPTRPSRASRDARLRGKKLRSSLKQRRRLSIDD